MQANNPQFRRAGDLKVHLVRVPLEDVVIDDAPDLRPQIRRLIIRDGFVLFPQHPHNQDPDAPFRDHRRHDTWTLTPTASRSMLHRAGRFTVKMPTDHPHGPDGPVANHPYDGKVDLREAVLASRARARHIIAVDARIGPSPHMLIQHDVLAIRDAAGGNGFVVRDVSGLRPDHYYVPAFSIPHIGRWIAERNGESFESFWRRHDAEAYGRVKAELLHRYGLVLETPNAQNRLIELDPRWRPTGRLVLRDLSDSMFHNPTALALGYGRLVQADPCRPSPTINPRTENSFWRMDEAGVSPETLRGWEAAHDAGYEAELTRVVGSSPRVAGHFMLGWGDLRRLEAHHRARLAAAGA